MYFSFVNTNLILYLQGNKAITIMTQLQSTKQINILKSKAIKKGGYAKFKNALLLACTNHFQLFGVDLTPKHL